MTSCIPVMRSARIGHRPGDKDSHFVVVKAHYATYSGIASSWFLTHASMTSSTPTTSKMPS